MKAKVKAKVWVLCKCGAELEAIAEDIESNDGPPCPYCHRKLSPFNREIFEEMERFTQEEK